MHMGYNLVLTKDPYLLIEQSINPKTRHSNPLFKVAVDGDFDSRNCNVTGRPYVIAFN